MEKREYTNSNGSGELEYVNSPFKPESQLRNVIGGRPILLGVLCRFGLSFGFGEKSVEEACKEDNVDAASFLAVCNLLTGRKVSENPISLPAMMNYLRKAHVHFLEFLLPSIRRKLIEAVNISGISDVAFLLLKFFDEYVKEVERHMHHENNEVFQYVDQLLQGNIQGGFRISEYSLHHGNMTEKLNDLKDIFIRHYKVKENEVLTSALTDIIYCGEALMQHSLVEDRLFIPAVERLENTLKLEGREIVPDQSEIIKDEAEAKQTSDISEEQSELLESLTEREKDIIRLVAKGLANKMIADELCLSIHTVTTHRRNISAKLQIHSPAGLTIFAIMNNLININEVDPHI